MIKKTLLIVFLTNICLPSVQGWESKLREDGKLIISNLSLNEERVFSSRVRGKLSIILDNQNLLLAINWGDFANLSDANVFYNIKEYGIFEEDWKLSNDGELYVAVAGESCTCLSGVFCSGVRDNIIGTPATCGAEFMYT